MKVRLLDPEGDFVLDPHLPPKLRAMVADDLEFRTLFTAMSGGDDFLYRVAEKVVPLGVTDPVAIEYRQNILTDCITNYAVIQQMYDIAVDAVEVRRKVFLGGLLFRDPKAILHSSVQILRYLAGNLAELRALCGRYVHEFGSDGFRQFIAMIYEQLSDAYLVELDEQLAELALPRGVLLSARLGVGNKGRNFVLHQPPQRSWWEKITRDHGGGLAFELDPRDQAGSEALNDLAGKAIDDVANAVAQAADHVKGFFERLRTELGFYLGCVNLHNRLLELGVPTCYPTPMPMGALSFRCRGLRDVGLCLTTADTVVGNDIDAEHRSLVMVTGANEGGKSTFLRSVGVAHVMMQAGMFVVAESFQADVVSAVLTHFKREEDKLMKHGKLDEELARMSAIADFLGTGALLLCNESFASTNEREGSQIALGVVDAAVESGIKVVFVTHMYDLAHHLFQRSASGYLFLRAQRRDDGVRTFRLMPGEPEPTSYGDDSFRRVFGTPVGAVSSGR